MKTSVLACLVLFINCTNNGKRFPAPDPLFETVSASVSGIGFVNEVKNTEQLNIFNFRNFYNGGGVAIGDINNDGLADIYFTANQNENRLYLNKGDFRFDDITKSSGTAGTKSWSTGVAMADINGDGWLDIYVCNSGDVMGKSRENELFINQKDGTFIEQAKEYGLQDAEGLSTHAAFFDYDGDGDLDCYILNNSYRPIESFGYNRNLRNVRDSKGGDKLLRNDNGVFTDVSEKANIYGSEIGFGLGVTIGDVNGDKWPDIYISNDFFERDYLYINQKDGTFKEQLDQSMGHISLSSMGADMADINNDGLLDVFCTDMLPEDDYRLKTTSRFDEYDVFNAKLQNDFHHQFTRNMLQLNNGDGTFSEIGQYADVYQTDWSWGALIFDFQNDGWKDLFVSNGISKDLTDQDFIDFMASSESLKRLNETKKFNYEAFLTEMKSTPTSNYAFINNGDLTFRNHSYTLGLDEKSLSNGSAYGDLDNDGDLDLVVNNVNMDAFVYRNHTDTKFPDHHYLKIKLQGEGMNTQGIGTEVTIFSEGKQQVLQQMPFRGFESCVEPVLNFGLGNTIAIDSLQVIWPDMKMQVIGPLKADTTLLLKQSEANLQFVYKELNPETLFTDISASLTGDVEHKENVYVDFDHERLMPLLLSIEGPESVTGDINNDGYDDIIVGGAKGDEVKIIMQKSEGRFVAGISPDIQQAKSLFEDAGLALFDADKDGDLDLLIASGGNETGGGSSSPHLLRFYRNDGKGNFTSGMKGFPIVATNASVVVTGDIDGDGDEDIFLGGRSVPGSYGVSPKSFVLINNGAGQFTSMKEETMGGLHTAGMITDAVIADIDKDGINELILVGDWMPLTIYKWDNNRMIRTLEMEGTYGWWNSIHVSDLDGDGDVDLIGGNLGLNSKLKGNKQYPLNMYVSDFDKNGQSECVLTYYKSDSIAYPLPLRSDMVIQMPVLKKKFLKYSDYASRQIDEVFDKEQLDKAIVRQANFLQSAIFINDGKGNFEGLPLPVEAQLSPVFDILTDDLNGDGFTDIFLVGNFSGVKPEIGKYDANYGQVFLGNGKNEFKYLPPSQSGLKIKGEARSISFIKNKNGKKYIMVTINNGNPFLFSGKS